MPVDLAFELSYLLSDKLGEDVEVVDWSFESETGNLCVRARVAGSERSACIEIKPCRGLEGVKAARCISKTLANVERLVEELALRLRG